MLASAFSTEPGNASHPAEQKILFCREPFCRLAVLSLLSAVHEYREKLITKDASRALKSARGVFHSPYMIVLIIGRIS
ncbi:MAG: hypothetical protein E5Y00_37670 [Mesorhizobium sp.]|nr:MAG: hypothetical protein E5Y00_37670 [Mesorhizobium sp.]